MKVYINYKSSVPEYYTDPNYIDLYCALEQYLEYGEDPYEIAAWAWETAEANDMQPDEFWDCLPELVSDYYMFH